MTIRIIQILSILAVVVLFAWIGWQNVVPAGVFRASYDFSDESPFVTPLSPGDRVLPIEQVGNDAFQAVIDDPVYFRVRAPRSFQRAHMVVRFQNPSYHPFKIGGLLSWDQYRFDLQNVVVVGEEQGWSVGEADFDLVPLFAPDGRTYTFAISLPGIMETDARVRITNIAITLERESQSLLSVVVESIKNQISNSRE